MKLEQENKQKKFKNEFIKARINIAYTYSWIQTNNLSVLKPFGLSIQQFNVLRILRGQHPKPVSVKSITERMIDKMSNASRLVEKLRLKGLVERTECGHDRRQVDIIITEKGLEVLAEASVAVEEIPNPQLTLTEEEAKLLNDLLDKFRS